MEDDVRRAAVAWVRQQAGLLLDEQEYGFLQAAAWFFAIGHELEVQRPDLEALDLQPAADLRTLYRRLSRLAGTTSTLDLYRALTQALLTVEKALDPARDAPALGRPFPLAATLEGTSYLFGGKVCFWLHPKSALAAERERRYQEAGEEDSAERPGRPPAPHLRIQDHLRELSMVWERKEKPRLVRPQSNWRRGIPLIERSGEAAARESFRIALCPLSDAFHPVFQADPSGRYFRAQGISDLKKLSDTLKEVVDAAEEAEVHLLVLPELMVPLQAREVLAARLRDRAPLLPYGVLAGSFHVPDDSSGSGILPVNEACLLDYRGHPLLYHHKQTGFRIRRRKALPPFFPGGPPAGSAAEIYEEIESGSDLAVLDTTLGRLAMLICFDTLIADKEHGFEDLVQSVRPDLLFVLSMSDKTQPFEDTFKQMAKHWIGTLYVNARCVCRPAKTPDRAKAAPLLAAYNLALQEADGDSPTRAFWRVEQEPDCPSYHTQPLRGGTGVTVHPLLGLVLDLGVHWDRRRREQGEREREQIENT